MIPGYRIFYCLMLIIPLRAGAQSLVTKVSKNKILIGEQFNVRLAVTVPQGITVNFYSIPDSLEGLEVVGRTPIDTLRRFDSLNMTQVITFTSFDSGHWEVPEFILAENLVTDSFSVDVAYAPADSSATIRDLKPILEAPPSKIKWYHFLIGGLLISLLIFIILRAIFLKRKPKPVKKDIRVSAYNEAMQALSRLQQTALQDAGAARKFHEALTDVFKTYCSRTCLPAAFSYTTSDLLAGVKSGLSSQAVSELAAALRLNDAVKFARFTPVADESMQGLRSIKLIIDQLEKKL